MFYGWIVCEYTENQKKEEKKNKNIIQNQMTQNVTIHNVKFDIIIFDE